MSLEWFLILVDRIDAIKGLLTVVAVLSAIAFVIYFWYPVVGDPCDEEKQQVSKGMRVALTALVGVTTLNLLIPSAKTVYMVGGAHYANRIVENPSPLFEEWKMLLEKKLDEALRD